MTRELSPEERAHEAALRLLAHRARSEQELRARLTRGGHPEEAIEAALARLRDSRLVDDDAFARERAGGLARRGSGPRLLEARLRAAGVEREAIQAAVTDALEAGGGEDGLARETLRRRYGDLEGADPDRRRKAAAWLVRRGFAPSVAARACGLYTDVDA